MTVEEYLAEAERFRALKEQTRDPFSQQLFAQWSDAIGHWPNATHCLKSRIGSRNDLAA